MNTTQEPIGDFQEEGPLALHIRRLRQWFGTDGMSQTDLAVLAGVSPRLLRGYESARLLPKSVEELLSIALVLRVPVERLIAPDQLDRLRRAIEERTPELERTVLSATRDNGATWYDH